MNGDTTPSNTLIVEAVSSTNSERTGDVHPSVETTEMNTTYEKLTTYTTNNSETTVSARTSETREVSMPNDETTEMNGRSEDATTKSTFTRDNERASSEITAPVYSQRSSTNPQTSTEAMSSFVETNSDMTSESPPPGVITEYKILTSEYREITGTLVTNDVATASDLSKGQSTPSEVFHKETTNINSGNGGTANTLSENVETTLKEWLNINITSNMTSENADNVYTVQTFFTKNVSELELTTGNTAPPAAGITDSSTEFLSALETSSSTERYGLPTENVSADIVPISPPTSMASAHKNDDQSSGDKLVAAVAGSFSVLAVICLAVAIFIACYKSQKLRNRVGPEISKHGEKKGGVENGFMQEMIKNASRQGRQLNEANTKNTTDWTMFMAETSLSKEPSKAAYRSVATVKVFNDEITTYSSVDERMPHSRSTYGKEFKRSEAVGNKTESSSVQGRPAKKVTLKELAKSQREGRLVKSTPEDSRIRKGSLNNDKKPGIGGTNQHEHEVEVYAVVNKKKEKEVPLPEKQDSKDLGSEMTNAKIADVKNLHDVYAIVDKSKKQATLETGTNDSDEKSRTMSGPGLSVDANNHLPVNLIDEDNKESQLDVNTKIKTKQVLKLKANSSEDRLGDSVPNPDSEVCESDPVQENRLKQVLDTSLLSSEDFFENTPEPVPKPRLKRLRANLIEIRLKEEHLPPRRLSVKDFPGDTGNL